VPRPCPRTAAPLPSHGRGPFAVLGNSRTMRSRLLEPLVCTLTRSERPSARRSEDLPRSYGFRFLQKMKPQRFTDEYGGFAAAGRCALRAGRGARGAGRDPSSSAASSAPRSDSTPSCPRGGVRYAHKRGFARTKTAEAAPPSPRGPHEAGWARGRASSGALRASTSSDATCGRRTT
jgi:hypothetical protein